MTDSPTINPAQRTPPRAWLVVDGVAVKSFQFQVASIYVPYIAAKRVFLFRWLALFLNNPKWTILVGDWNVILDPKIDRVGRGTRGSGRCESSLIDLLGGHNWVDRYRLDHPEREMWTRFIARLLSEPDLIWTEC